MDLQTAPAVHPPLLDSVTEETLRRNVTKVLETLAENRYQDSPPAKLVAVTKTVTPRVINLLKPGAGRPAQAGRNCTGISFTLDRKVANQQS